MEKLEITENTERITEELFSFIDKSPTAYHAVAEAARLLKVKGYREIADGSDGEIRAGGRYYITRNASSLIAFRIPEGEWKGFRIVASHSDSPCFKVKESPEMEAEGYYVKLNTEGYGGMIMSTWMDRPLSVAGRVILEGDEGVESRLVNFDRDLCVIPNVAIHFNREINKGFACNPQVDLLPLFAGKTEEAPAGMLKRMCAEYLETQEEKILATDLYLYCRDRGRRMGACGEFIGSPRLDDLQCAYGTLAGFLADNDMKNASSGANCADHADYAYCAVYALFNNEEIGSGTMQGADSTFLEDVLDMICCGLGLGSGEKRRLLAQSFLLSADNAHAVHPNHPEKSDPTNRPLINGGVVLKFQGSQKYTTDGFSAALVRSLCQKAGVPCQDFANRSDMAGGSTLGNISSAHVSVHAADIGLPQLAMHSAFETAGVKDTEYLVRLCEAYFE